MNKAFNYNIFTYPSTIDTLGLNTTTHKQLYINNNINELDIKLRKVGKIRKLRPKKSEKSDFTLLSNQDLDTSVRNITNKSYKSTIKRQLSTGNCFQKGNACVKGSKNKSTKKESARNNKAAKKILLETVVLETVVPETVVPEKPGTTKSINIQVIEDSTRRKCTYTRTYNNKASIYKGVYIRKNINTSKPYLAKIVYRNKYYSIGIYETELQAAAAYDIAIKEILNSPDMPNKAIYLNYNLPSNTLKILYTRINTIKSKISGIHNSFIPVIGKNKLQFMYTKYSLNECSKRLNISIYILKKHLNYYNIKEIDELDRIIYKNRLSKNKLAKLFIEYNTQSKLAAYLGINRRTLNKLLKSMGVSD